MGERIKKAAGKVKELTGKLSKGLKRAIIILLVLAVIGIAALLIARANRPYAVLFTDLSSEDMTAVLAYLSENNVTDIKLDGNDTVLVREERVDSLKAGLLQQGYPSSGYGYETYLNNVGILSSETDRQHLTTYDLQDQLANVIRRFDGVKEASVIIATSSSNRYILSDSVVEATATVMVEMERGKTLSSQQVEGIRNGVTHAVAGLDFSDVAIIDPMGTPYGGGDGNASLADSADLKMSLQNQIDAEVRSKILAALIPLYGLENISVSVTSTVDVSKSYSETMTYVEPEWAQDGDSNGRGIIGTWVWDRGIVRGENTVAGGVAGTTTNADLNEYVINEGDIRGDEQEIGTSGEINYNVGYVKTQSEPSGGLLTDMMVAVIINSAVSDQLDTPINTNRLVPIVARAAGIGTELEEEKVAIAVMPFYVDPNIPQPAEPTELEAFLNSLPWWVRYAVIAGGILFVILLTVAIIVIRRAKKRRQKRLEEQMRIAAEAQAAAELAAKEAAEAAAAAAAAEGGENGADIMNMNTDKTMELRKDVRQFAEDNPAIAAQMIKAWMHSGDES